jgi:hypothetical protein
VTTREESRTVPGHPIDHDIDDFEDMTGRLIQDRTYRVRVYAEDDHMMRARGMVRDIKPPGVYVRSDPDPLTVHHMVVDLLVSYPELEVRDANVVIETHPNVACPRVADHYKSLIGLSIARGFTHQIRALFGGPRGCTHTTALLQAMAPAVVQATWSMRSAQDASNDPATREAAMKARNEARVRHNVDSCHVWAADGELTAVALSGVPTPVLLPLARRMKELGLDPQAEWREWVQR